MLLRLLEAKELFYTHSALVDFYGKPGEELIASGLLVEAGYDRVVRDDDDDGAMVDVDSDPHHEGLGYNSRTSGFVRVGKPTLLRYGPCIENLFRQLLGAELTWLPDGPQPLEREGNFWDLGVAALNRQGTTSVWFGRRFHDLAVREVLADLLTRKPSSTPRLVLSTTPVVDLPRDHLPGVIVVPIGDVLGGMNPVMIDFAMLKARFTGKSAEAIESPVHLSHDGKTLTLNYTVTINFRGAIQINIVRILVDAYRKGREVLASRVLIDAGSQARTFEQAFGSKWRLMEPYLTARNGTWAFRL